MISAILRFNIDHRPRTMEEGYVSLLAIIDLLPVKGEWYGGVNAPGQRPVPYRDKQVALVRLQERARMLSEHGLSTDAFSAVVSSDNKEMRLPGLFEVDYSPSDGRLSISIYRPDQASEAASNMIVKTMEAVLESEPSTSFAYVDVYDKVDGKFKYYRSAYATFPHRQCLGWMAFVPKTIAQEQLPMAAAIIPTKSGSIVIATQEPFDLANKEHIKRANQIEMDMNDLGLLGVNDPTL